MIYSGLGIVPKCQPVAFNLLKADGVMWEADREKQRQTSYEYEYWFTLETALEQVENSHASRGLLITY